LEPWKVARALRELDLGYVVVTSVDRDDLPDQGAGHFARTIACIKRECPDMVLEVLIPDFRGEVGCLEQVVRAGPDVVAHNLETVRRLTARVRDRRATYDQSIFVLQSLKDLGAEYTKSSIMLGLGEEEAEVLEAMDDLRAAGVDILTLGQYLRPSDWHLEVREYVHPSTFDHLRRRGEERGFLYVASGPLVRSSYRAGEFFLERAIKERKGEHEGDGRPESIEALG
jgi:lipoic acid synthetase